MRWDLVKPEDVAKAKNFSESLRLFARYCQQVVGTPMPDSKAWGPLGARVKAFFIEYPQADWYTLCRIAQWCRNHKLRARTTVGLVGCFRSAWSDGAIPELDPANLDLELEREIERALEIEMDDSWRRRLYLARGTEARRAALEEWTKERCAASATTPGLSGTGASTARNSKSSSTSTTKRKSRKRATASSDREIVVVDLGLPPTKPLSINEERSMTHFGQRTRRLDPWRDLAWAMANNQNTKEQVAGRRGRITVVIPFRTRAVRDPHNYFPIVKSVVDGLVRALVWPDDNPEYVEVLEPRLVIGKNALVEIEVTP